MVLFKLRSLKEEVQKNYRKKNNMPKEQRNSLNKLNSFVKNRNIVICSSHKDGKIVILNYEDYNSIMLRELKDFKTVMMVGCTIVVASKRAALQLHCVATSRDTTSL